MLQASNGAGGGACSELFLKALLVQKGGPANPPGRVEIRRIPRYAPDPPCKAADNLLVLLSHREQASSEPQAARDRSEIKADGHQGER